jgi:diguanylate cyclase
MAKDVETTLRGPQSYDLARRTIEAMEHHQVWPTPLNYELWLHFVCNPDGPIGKEISRLLKAGEAFTEHVTEELAASYLPKAKLNDQIRDAGDKLSQELASVAKAISSAQQSSAAYGETLAEVGQELAHGGETPSLTRIVETLTTATRKVQHENKSLEEQLKDSTAEVARLRTHLEQVRRDATTDGLTNLANRKAFDDELDRAVAEAAETGQALTLAVLDIDHFKNFNDTWGHQTGDQVLRYVASVLARVAVAPRFAARYGGEEFGMIFPAETAGSAERVLEEIRREVCSRTLKRRSTNEDLGTVSVSVGLAEGRPGESAHDLMERADGALYVSKRTGRNRVTTADEIADAA